MNALVGTADAVSTPAPPPPAAAKVREYLGHIHLLRGVAILMVVGAHTMPAFNFDAFGHSIFLIAFNDVTVTFMFIAGLLFQHLSNRFHYPSYVKKRLLTVVLPYILISIPGIVLVVFFMHRVDVWPWVYEMPAWKQMLFFLLTGKTLAPLWFIPMMTLFILTAPVFIAIDRRDLYAWLLPPTIVIATYLGRDSVPGVFGVLGKAIFMLPAYLAGMGFSHHRVAVERWCERNLWKLLLVFAVVAAALIVVPDQMEWTLIEKLVLTLLLIVVLKHARLPQWLEHLMGVIAGISFAIYFVHGYVIAAFRTIYIHFMPIPAAELATGTVFPPSVIGLIAVMAAVTLISWLIVVVLKRLVGGNSRMLIGA